MNGDILTVIIPTYNSEKYIKECLDSLLKQTRRIDEILIVDDGSTDNTLKILDDYRRKNENIRVIENSHQGVLYSRKTGYENAKGDYIGWVDSDDFVDEDMYDVLYNTAIQNNADYVYCNYRFYPKKVPNKAKWFKEYTSTIDWKYIERNTQFWNTLTKKKLLDDVRLGDNILLYGEYVWISVLLNSKKTISIIDELYNYRVGHDSLSGKKLEGKTQKFIEGSKQASKLKDILANTPYKNSLNEYFDYRYVYTLLQLLVVASANGDKRVFEETKKKLKDYKDNTLTKVILSYNHSPVKSFVLRDIIPLNYYLSHIICKIL